MRTATQQAALPPPLSWELPIASPEGSVDRSGRHVMGMPGYLHWGSSVFARVRLMRYALRFML